MDQKSFGYLAAALVALLLIIILATGGGLNSHTVMLLDQEASQYDAAVSKFGSAAEQIRTNVAEDKALFATSSAAWLERISKAEKLLGGVSKELDAAEELAAEDDNEKRIDIEMKLDIVHDARLAAINDVNQVSAAVRRLLDLRSNRAKFVALAKQRHQSISSFDYGGLETEIKRAIVDWPEKQADLNKRLNRLNDNKGHADRLWKVIETEDAKELAAINFNLLSSAARDLSYLAKDVLETDGHIRKSIKQLYTSWDKILVDMSIDEGYEVKFRHRYKTTTIEITDPVKKEGQALPAVERWQNITKAEYDRRKGQLGMAIAYKPAGKYDSEATRDTPQPPGYSYIASPQRGSNQYGRWNNSGGTSFWVFYGQYSFMRSMFWGYGYSPIYHHHYSSYYSHRSRGRSYYGTTSTGGQRFGTSGTATKTRYASSRYVKSNGFKNSKYVSSGGKYKGSRYTARPARSSRTPSRTSSRRASRSSSRSRSFGGGSRSFGGK